MDAVVKNLPGEDPPYPKVSFQMPSALMEYFIRFAAANTRKKNETLAYVAGFIQEEDKKEVLVAKALHLPLRDGTPDSCWQTSPMLEYFDFLCTNKLVQVGWIHTHPTQTNFLSSVDLHTQHKHVTLQGDPRGLAFVVSYKDKKPTWAAFRESEIGSYMLGKCRAEGHHESCAKPFFYERVWVGNSKARHSNFIVHNEAAQQTSPAATFEKVLQSAALEDIQRCEKAFAALPEEAQKAIRDAVQEKPKPLPTTSEIVDLEAQTDAVPHAPETKKDQAPCLRKQIRMRLHKKTTDLAAPPAYVHGFASVSIDSRRLVHGLVGVPSGASWRTLGACWMICGGPLGSILGPFWHPCVGIRLWPARALLDQLPIPTRKSRNLPD